MTNFRRLAPCVLVLGLVACNGSTSTPDSGHSVSSPTCEMILERCHPLDTGSGEIHECHEMSEANVEADCVAMRDHCLMVCAPVDAGN